MHPLEWRIFMASLFSCNPLILSNSSIILIPSEWILRCYLNCKLLKNRVHSSIHLISIFLKFYQIDSNLRKVMKFSTTKQFYEIRTAGGNFSYDVLEADVFKKFGYRIIEYTPPIPTLQKMDQLICDNVPISLNFIFYFLNLNFYKFWSTLWAYLPCISRLNSLLSGNNWVVL